MDATTPAAGDFVRSVIAKLDLGDHPRQAARDDRYRGAGELARKLGVATETVRRWLRDERDPEYIHTMQMLQWCGWLNMGADAPTAAMSADPLAELRATVEAQGRATTLALRALSQGIGKLEKRLVAEDPPATGRRKA